MFQFRKTKQRLDIRELTVLLVDDQDSLLRLYARAASMAGQYRVETSNNPVAVMKRLPGIQNLAVVVSDGHMPGMHGAELLRYVRDTHPYTTRIMITGTEQCPPAGLAHHFLAKPFQIGQLGERVRIGVDEYLQRYIAEKG